MIGYQHFMTVGGTSFPYTDQGVEENAEAIMGDDLHTGQRSTMHFSPGVIRYAGPISTHMHVTATSLLKTWAVTSYDTAQTVIIDTGNQAGGRGRYRYNLKVGTWELTGNPEGSVDTTVNTYGWGSDATDRTRESFDNGSILSDLPPVMNTHDYAPIPWYLSSWVCTLASNLTQLTWGTAAATYVTAWNVTINNNQASLGKFDGYQVTDIQQATTLSVEGSFTLYNASGIRPPSGPRDWFSCRLDLVQTQTSEGVFGSAASYLNFPVCVPTAYPDAGAARNAKKTLTINWTGMGDGTNPAVY